MMNVVFHVLTRLRRLCMMLALTWPLAMVSCTFPPLDGSARYEGRRISKVTIVHQGRKWVDEERLRNLMTMKKGAVYSGHAADEDLKSLYESQLVDDAFIRVAPDHGQVQVKAVVTTRPGLGAGPHVLLVGNNAFSDQKLFLEGFKGNGNSRLFYRTKVEIAGKKMEAYYRRMGFSGATVRLDTKRSKMWPLHALPEQEYYLQVEEGVRTESSASPPSEAHR
ncbi:MAG: hypothetical protein EOP88_00010 [Verrucomicrobiaceae bacterium]|nr:MAG: hypothetical protein EOP88_00010 [Verrucomicrobiaceae bacterium]